MKRSGYLLLGLFLLAGVIYTLVHTSKLRVNDEIDYLSLSHNLLHGPGYSLDGTTLTAFRPPGYPFFLAALQVFGAGVKTIHLVQVGLLGGIILLLTRFGSRESRFPGPLIAVVLTALYPVQFYLCGTLYPQVFGTFFFLLALALLLRMPRTWPVLVGSGLSFGLLILAIPTFGLTLVILLVAARVLRLVSWRDTLLVFVAASMLIGVWTARNALLFHRFIPLASNSGVNLMIGNCPEARAHLGGGSLALTHYFEESERLKMNEFEADRYFRDVALDWISKNPGQALELYGEKVLNYFNIWNQYAPGSAVEISPWKEVVMAISYILLLALLAWRLTEARRYPLASWEKLFLVVYVLSAFTMAIFLTRIRHRVPYDFLLIAIVATHVGRRLQPWVEDSKQSALR